MKDPHPIHGARFRLFWRLYLFGLLGMITTMATAVGLVTLLGSHPPWLSPVDRLAANLFEEFGAEPAATPALQARLDQAHDLLGFDLALLRADGSTIAWSGNQELPLKLHRHTVVLDPAAAASATLVMGAKDLPERFPGRMLLGLLAMLLVLGLVSLALTHTLTRPLRRLTQTAQRLAGGDLAARTEIVRKDELGVLARTMDEMAGRLALQVRSERELLANLSHEIRTPLARIRVALELCAEEPVTLESVRKQLAGIESDVGELERLVNDVLTIYRLDVSSAAATEGGLVLHKETLGVSALVSAAAERFHKTHPGRVLRTLLPPAPGALTIDPVLLRRVLDNLLDNAKRYSEAEVELEVLSEPGTVRIEVRDRGMGIPAEDLPRLFEPFYRTAESRAKNPAGLGLGLTLGKRVVEAHGGTLRAEARPGGGTVFSISLPQASS
jgi:signal transduction histidine kinase